MIDREKGNRGQKVTRSVDIGLDMHDGAARDEERIPKSAIEEFVIRKYGEGREVDSDNEGFYRREYTEMLERRRSYDCLVERVPRLREYLQATFDEMEAYWACRSVGFDKDTPEKARLQQASVRKNQVYFDIINDLISEMHEGAPWITSREASESAHHSLRMIEKMVDDEYILEYVTPKQ